MLEGDADRCCLTRVDGVPPGGGESSLQPEGYFYSLTPANSFSGAEQGITVNTDATSGSINGRFTWILAMETGTAAITARLRFFGTTRDMTGRLYINGVVQATDVAAGVATNDTIVWDLGSHSLTRGDILSVSIESSTGALGAAGGYVRVLY